MHHIWPFFLFIPHTLMKSTGHIAEEWREDKFYYAAIVAKKKDRDSFKIKGAGFNTPSLLNRPLPPIECSKRAFTQRDFRKAGNWKDRHFHFCLAQKGFST